MKRLLILLAACGGTENDFHKPWTFTVVSATVTATKDDGSMWDPDNSAPDPFATVTLAGTVLGMTETRDDTLAPFWNTALDPVVVDFGETLSIDLTDEDTTFDDSIMAGCLIPLTQAFVDAGTASCKTSQATVTISVDVP
jgi:Ca2+-dependent lipid-binding protein